MGIADFGLVLWGLAVLGALVACFAQSPKDEAVDPLTPELMDVTEEEAQTRFMKLTCELKGKSPPFWGDVKRMITNPPPGVRLYPECAVMIMSEELVERGVVQLKYHDHTDVLISLKEALAGDVLMPDQVTQKYLRRNKEEKSMLGHRYWE